MVAVGLEFLTQMNPDEGNGFKRFVFIRVHLCFHFSLVTGTAGDGEADLETQMNTNKLVEYQPFCKVRDSGTFQSVFIRVNLRSSCAAKDGTARRLESRSQEPAPGNPAQKSGIP